MLSYPKLIRHEGNDWLFRAIEMSVLSLQNGIPLHLHAEGVRGTGKTTIFRTARHFLPRITRIKGCIYNCDPQSPHCPQHRHLSPEEIAALGTEEIPMPFLEISHSAKIGTVVGSIDLTRLTDRTSPQAALLPGTIPQAHRGILFVDEINRLAETSPELADVLLSVMGTKPGRLQIEETGLPVVELPVSVSVWAASNPDEDPGPLEDIRRQLADRFDLTVAMQRPTRVETILEILASQGVGREGVKGSDGRAPNRNYYSFFAHPNGLSVNFPPQLQELVGRIYVDFKLESLRAVEALVLGSRLHAQLLGQTEVRISDLAALVPLALRHRVNLEAIGEIVGFLENWRERDGREEETRRPAASGSGPVPVKVSSGREGNERWVNPWGQLFSRLRERLNSKDPGGSEQIRLPATPGETPKRLTREKREQAGFGASSAQPTGATPPEKGGQSGSGQAANPLQVEILAPPFPARPISQLNLREIFSLGEERLP